MGDPEVVSLRVDVTREEDQKAQVDATLDRFGALDVALNNAGVFQPLMRISDTPLEEFQRVMTVNAQGVFLALKHQCR